MTPDTLLADLDLALAGDPGADRDLLELVADVRDQAPTMTPAFADALHERVRSGFAPAATATARRRRRRPVLYVLGPALAAVLVAVVVVSENGGRSATTVAPAASGKAVQLSPSVTAGPAARTPAVPAVPSPPIVAGTPESEAAAPGRRVERTTSLTLSTTTDNVQAVAAGVVRATQQAGGFVSSSQVQIDGTHGTATFTLRIPAARLEPALTALNHLARVTSMSQSTQDITGEFASTNARLAALQAQLIALHRRRQTPFTIVRERTVAQEIATQRAALSGLRHRADYVTVELQVSGHPRHHHAAVHHGSSFTPRRALHDAGRILEVVAAGLVIALTILIPLGVLLTAAWLAARAVRRRHRQAALKLS
jgi:uncharacterized protein DUF4349